MLQTIINADNYYFIFLALSIYIFRLIIIISLLKQKRKIFFFDWNSRLHEIFNLFLYILLTYLNYFTVMKHCSIIMYDYYGLLCNWIIRTAYWNITICYFCSLSECYFAGKGAALVLPPNERARPSRRVSAAGCDIQQHLQSMFYLLRPEETLKMVSKKDFSKQPLF